MPHPNVVKVLNISNLCSTAIYKYWMNTMTGNVIVGVQGLFDDTSVRIR